MSTDLDKHYPHGTSQTEPPPTFWRPWPLPHQHSVPDLCWCIDTQGAVCPCPSHSFLGIYRPICTTDSQATLTQSCRNGWWDPRVLPNVGDTWHQTPLTHRRTIPQGHQVGTISEDHPIAQNSPATPTLYPRWTGFWILPRMHTHARPTHRTPVTFLHRILQDIHHIYTVMISSPTSSPETSHGVPGFPGDTSTACHFRDGRRGGSPLRKRTYAQAAHMVDDTTLYFEPQRRQFCAVHSYNMAIGYAALDPLHLLNFCDGLTRQGVPNMDHSYAPRDGRFSAFPHW